MRIYELSRTETLATLKEQNAKGMNRKGRLLEDLHQFTGLDYMKPFRVYRIEGRFTLRQIEDELHLNGTRYIIGLKLRYGHNALQFATVYGARLDLFPCQFCENIWRKGDFEEARKRDDAYAVVIYQEGLLNREYYETPAVINRNKTVNENKARQAERARKLRTIKRNKDEDAFKKIEKAEDIKTAEALKSLIIEEFKERASAVESAYDLRVLDCWQRTEALRSIEQFLNVATATEGTASGYAHRKSDVERTYNSYARQMLG